MAKDYILISGGISGAITDPYSDEADIHAKMYYEEIRHNHADVKKIAENTGFTVDQILMIKNFLFIDVHDLEGKIRRFDESFGIAESWRRLAFDPEHIQYHDLTLLKHELYERKLMLSGKTQEEAHTIASKKYDYTKEMTLFYEQLKKDKVIPKRKFDSGAVKSSDYVR